MSTKTDHAQSRVEKEESASVLLVSAADKLANASAILSDSRAGGDALGARFNNDAGKDGTIGYSLGLVNADQARGFHPRLNGDLSLVVDQLEEAAGHRGRWPPVQPVPKSIESSHAPDRYPSGGPSRRVYQRRVRSRWRHLITNGCIHGF